MREYRILMHVVIVARDDAQAHQQAKKLGELLKNPMVKMAIEGENIGLSGDGRPVVYAPQRESA